MQLHTGSETGIVTVQDQKSPSVAHCSQQQTSNLSEILAVGYK